VKKIIRLTESDLTHIVKRVINENSKRDIFIELIKKNGWDEAAEYVGGAKNLKKLTGINDPMEFLNLFNDLNVDMGDNGRGIFTNDEGDRIITISPNSMGKVFASVDSHAIWAPFRHLFPATNAETANLIRRWLKEVYGIKVFIAKEVAF
jgi:uncharacterized FAD-dependent dehydrogenase